MVVVGSKKMPMQTRPHVYAYVSTHSHSLALKGALYAALVAQNVHNVDFTFNFSNIFQQLAP